MPGLDGVLVVEVGDGLGVRACGGLLVDLGADVVVLEPATARTSAERDRAPLLGGKRSVIDADADRCLVDELVEAADVVLTSSDVDGRSRVLRESAHGRGLRGQIVCDLTAFGGDGPLAGTPATDGLLQGWTGTASVTGRPDGPPVVSPVPAVEMEAAAYAAAAICAARYATGRGRPGQLVEIALYDVAVNALAAFLPLPLTGRSAHRNGNRHATLSPWNTYPTDDGWIMVCSPTDRQWRRLCAVMDQPDLADDPACATTTARMVNAERVDAHVAAWTRRRSGAACQVALDAAGLPVGPIVALDRLADEPNLRHRNMLRTAQDPVTATVLRMPGNPFDPGDATARPLPQPGSDEGWVRRRLAGRRRARTQATAAGSAGAERDDPPLRGVRVVEIGMNTVGPLAGRQLGALGADVIKVEPPVGDSNRGNAPLREDGQSYIFALSNTDKRGVVLDLRADTDRAALWQLLDSADVVIENLKPGSLHRLGFGAEHVQGRLPRLVYCSMNGFGHDSAYPGRPALDTVVQAMAGIMDATDPASPTKLGISVSDQMGGIFGLVAVLAALVERQHTGNGRSIDISMQDVTAWATYPLWNGGRIDPHEVVACADGHVVIRPDVLDDAQRSVLATASTSSRTQLTTRLTRRLGARPGPPACAPVLSVAEVIAAAHTTARRLLVDRPAADGAHWTVLETPLRLHATPAAVRAAMPALGFPDPALAAELQGPPADAPLGAGSVGAGSVGAGSVGGTDA